MQDPNAFARRNVWLARAVLAVLVALMARALLASAFGGAALPGVAFWMASPVLVVLAIYFWTARY